MIIKILSIDPGMSSGVALGVLDGDHPYTLEQAWQIEGGAFSLLGWASGFVGTANLWVGDADDLEVVAEKFQPINHSNYALTTASVEPLRCEGVLLALDMMLDYPHETWRHPKDQYFIGGVDLADKKKRAHRFLKDNGMYVTGKTMGCADANDARSAILHGVSYAIKVLKHKPTHDMVTQWIEKEGQQC